MEINLTKAIAFFDLETTGINITKDRIIEISILKQHPDQSTTTYTRKVNPLIPIPLETSEIHGIYDIDVKNEASFAELADEIKEFIGDADLAGYNSNKFDIPLLIEEFLRNDKNFDMKNRRMIDIQNIFHKMEERTLSAAYKFYCDKELVNAHSAEADTFATFEILKAQLSKYENLDNNMDFLHDFSLRGNNKPLDFAGRIAENKEGEPIFNFGKYKNQTIEDVFKKDKGYYGWILNSDFPLYTKQLLKKIKEDFKK